MFKTLDLAKYVVTKCMEDGHPITKLQLQRIMYYIQSDYLKQGKVAFPDDFEAWIFGPALPNVYYEFCAYGVIPINHRFHSTISSEDSADIDIIIKKKATVEYWDLAAEVQSKGSPWDLVFHGGAGNKSVIPKDLIEKGELVCKQNFQTSN